MTPRIGAETFPMREMFCLTIPRFFLLLAMLAVAPAAWGESPPRPDAATPAAGKQESGWNPTPFFERTAPALRPPASRDLIALMQELSARGQEAAARTIAGNLSPTADDFDRLVRAAIKLYQLGAADLLLTDWARRFPKDGRADVLRTAYYMNMGEMELARRQLTFARASAAPEDQPLVGLMSQVVQLAELGRPVGVDVNPWGVRFVDESGRFSPGAIAPEQAGQIPSDAVPQLARLLEIVPRQGNLWALLGELLNAAGEPRAALEAMQRAEILLYTPRTLLEHRRALEEHQRAAAKALEERLSGGPAANPPSGAVETSPGEELSVGVSRPAIYAILAVGSSLILVISALQVREWMKAIARRRKR